MKVELHAIDARCEALKPLHLEVDRSNVAAQALHRSAGFHDHDRL